MTKSSVLCTVGIVALLGCSGPPPATPADEVEPKENGSEVEPTEPETTEPETTEPETTEPETTEPETTEATPPSKPSCGGLPKARCQVTQGCAYHDQDGCVPYGDF